MHSQDLHIKTGTSLADINLGAQVKGSIYYGTGNHSRVCIEHFSIYYRGRPTTLECPYIHQGALYMHSLFLLSDV